MSFEYFSSFGTRTGRNAVRAFYFIEISEIRVANLLGRCIMKSTLEQLFK